MSDYLKELYLKNSRIPTRYLSDIKLRATNGDAERFMVLKKIEDNIVNFTKDGKNLLLSSNHVGNGKTTWAVKIMKSYVEKYACNYAYKYSSPALFINVPEFLIQKKLSISDVEIASEVSEIEKCIYTAKIVVFDDIATKTASDYDKELLYSYINSRTNNLLTSIYTTNVSKDDLADELGERLASRIIRYSVCIELKGADLRGVSV